MTRLPHAFAVAFATFALLLPSVADARGTFDAAAALVRLPKESLRSLDFESPDSLVGLELAKWDNSGNFPVLARTPIANPADVAARLTANADDVVEGAHALRLGDAATGLVIRDAALFDRVKNARFEVTLWGRADGTAPQLYVLYDRDPANVFGASGQFAEVRAIRTGRQTSDGWAEISTGPLDGNVWGVPVRGIAIVPSSGAAANDSFLVDALDIQIVPGAPTAPLACAQDTVEAVCGAEADCMFGHCVSSTVTWGALPQPAHRSEIAERWIMLGTRIIGDRAGAKHGLDVLTPQARALAANATSSRQFFGGMNHLVNQLRDNHTSFGSPNNFTEFEPQVDFGSSSVIGACFGVVEKDIAGGGLGFAVFRASDAPSTGIKLQRGDLLYAIDGRDPKEWLDEVWPRYATTLPNDPASDWGAVAGNVSRLLTTRASNVTLLRCASASACDAKNRQEITIDVAKVIYDAIVNPPATAPTSQRFYCTQRFSETAGEGGGGFSGEDSVRTAKSGTGETLVEFDGFVGQTKWQAAFRQIFQAAPARVIMDARMGHGGYYQAVLDLFNLLRGTSEPMGVLSFGRGTYDLVDPPWLFDRLGQCTTQLQDQWACFEGNATGFFASSSSPPGGASKIAWLNTNDVSANDFMPRLLKGRSNLRIFAPHPTAGAFGAIAELPSIATNWSGGSLQVEDSRFAPDKATASTVRWESSHGVVPDVFVAEKLSDAITGTDTMVQAATAWLEAP